MHACAHPHAPFRGRQALVHRQWLVAGLLLHMMAVAFQWQLVVHPEYPYDAPTGAPPAAGGGGGGGAAATLLTAHWAAAWAYCAGLVAALHRGPRAERRTRACGHHFVGVKLAHLAVCLAATVQV